MRILSAIEAPYLSEPQTEFETVLLSTFRKSTSDFPTLQFVDYAGSPGGRECRFQTSNVFESGWKLCQQLEQLGFARTLEAAPVEPESRQEVTVQYQKEGVAVWLIAHVISVSIVVFEFNR